MTLSHVMFKSVYSVCLRYNSDIKRDRWNWRWDCFAILLCVVTFYVCRDST